MEVGSTEERAALIPYGRGCNSAIVIEKERIFESAYHTAMNCNRRCRVFPRLAGINVLILQEASRSLSGIGSLEARINNLRAIPGL